VHAQPDLSGMPVALGNLVASCLAKAPSGRPLLPQLMVDIMSASAFDRGSSPTDFWPEPVAGLISSRQNSFSTEVASRAGGGPAAVMFSLPHEPTTPATAGSRQYGEEATRTAASSPGALVNPPIDEPEPQAKESTLAKPGTAQLYETGAINRVPRTEGEQQQLLVGRPYAWEYLYFASRLLHERNSVENKYRNHLEGYPLAGDQIISYKDFTTYVNRVMRDTQRLMHENVQHVWNRDAQERAFGPPGVDGDPEALAHLAKRMNDLYEGLMDWAAKVRGVSRPSEFDVYIKLLASVNDNAISVYRKFVDDLVAHNDQLPSRITAGEPSEFKMTVRFSIPKETTDSLHAEFARLSQVEMARLINAARARTSGA
jgi:hypothetical protein